MIALKHKAVSATMSIPEGKRGKSLITESEYSGACEKITEKHEQSVCIYLVNHPDMSDRYNTRRSMMLSGIRRNEP